MKSSSNPSLLKRNPLRHTVCSTENIVSVSSNQKSQDTRVRNLEYLMNDMLRQMSNMQNQMQAMKLKLEAKEERIQLLEKKFEKFERRESEDK